MFVYASTVHGYECITADVHVWPSVACPVWSIRRSLSEAGNIPSIPWAPRKNSVDHRVYIDHVPPCVGPPKTAASHHVPAKSGRNIVDNTVTGLYMVNIHTHIYIMQIYVYIYIIYIHIYIYIHI